MLNDRRFIIAAAIIAVIAAAVIVYTWRSDRSGIPTIDLSKTVPRKAVITEDTRPVLRLAVAAMISPEETRTQYDALLKLVGDKLGMRVVFLQRRTYAEVNTLVEDNSVDMAFVCSGPYVTGHDQFGMQIVAVPVVSGRKVYYSYIIVNADSPYRSFADLRGKRFAFTDPDSNTGCLVPRYMLSKIGETPKTFFSDTFYTHSHDNSIMAVAEGKADGAAVDSLIWGYINSNNPEITSRTRVVQKSVPYGIPPIVVGPGIDPGLKNRLQETLLHLHEDKTGRAILAKLKIDRFDYADDHDYDEVRQMQKWLSVQGF